MHIVVIAATQNEVAPFLQWLQHKNQDVFDGIKITVHITGVGLLASTYAITQLLMRTKCDVIIQAGIAGSFDAALPIGAACLVEKDMVADAGVFENNQWENIFQMGLVNPNEMPYRNGWLVNPFVNQFKQWLPFASAVTVNEITTNKERITIYQQNFGAQLESMEGAALHYAALLQHIPFVQLRTISNKVGERNKANWNIPLAIGELNSQLQKLIAFLIENQKHLSFIF